MILFVRTVHCVDFHTDGSAIISGSADRTIKMWDIRSHQLIQHYGAHTDVVTSTSMHPVRIMFVNLSSCLSYLNYISYLFYLDY